MERAARPLSHLGRKVQKNKMEQSQCRSRKPAKKAKKAAPRGIKKFSPLQDQVFLLSAEKKGASELRGPTVMSGAERRVTRGCAGEEGAKPPDPESRGRSMTRGPRAGHDNGRRDAGPVSHTLWTPGSKAHCMYAKLCT